MSQHTKRFEAPLSWGSIDVKKEKFIITPNPGAQPFLLGLSLAVWLKRVKLATTMREIKKILTTKNVMVNGRRATDPHTSTGFLDVLSIPDINLDHRVMLDENGVLILTPSRQPRSKPFKIINKTRIKHGKTQLNLIGGTNLLIEKDSYKTGDTVVLSLPDLKITSHLKLEPGARVAFTGGKHIGDTGTLKTLEKETVTYTSKTNKELKTIKEHTYVIPNEL